MKQRVFVGWNEYSVVAYISAVTFARYKATTKHVNVEPLPYEPHMLQSIIPKESRDIFYLFGSFSENDIRGFLGANTRITVVGKLYGGVFDKISRPVRVKHVKVYPVSKDYVQGLEYLDVLSRFFGKFSETDFFMKLLSIKDELRSVLATTDSWVEAFNQLVSPEVTTGCEDIPRVLEYIKRRSNFDDVYKKFVDKIQSSVVVDRGAFAVVKVEASLAKKAVILGKQLLNRRNVAVVVASSTPRMVYVTSIDPIPASVAMAVGATLSGKLAFHSGKVVLYNVSLDEKTLIEKLQVAMELVSVGRGGVKRGGSKNYYFCPRSGVTVT